MPNRATAPGGNKSPKRSAPLVLSFTAAGRIKPCGSANGGFPLGEIGCSATDLCWSARPPANSRAAPVTNKSAVDFSFVMNMVWITPFARTATRAEVKATDGAIADRTATFTRAAAPCFPRPAQPATLRRKRRRGVSSEHGAGLRARSNLSFTVPRSSRGRPPPPRGSCPPKSTATEAPGIARASDPLLHEGSFGPRAS